MRPLFVQMRWFWIGARSDQALTRRPCRVACRAVDHIVSSALAIPTCCFPSSGRCLPAELAVADCLLKPPQFTGATNLPQPVCKNALPNAKQRNSLQELVRCF